MARMRAAVLDAPGPPSALSIREVDLPIPKSGWVLIRVHAFGLNRSELHFRRGMGSFGSFPRIPGIEAAGVVVECPGGEIEIGTQVMALMGGMGRTIDGGYAEFVCVPVSSAVVFVSSLGWDVLGAVPEMLQTAHGSLTVGTDVGAGQSLLIRGGTSSVGLALAVLARRAGATVFTTTRNAARSDFLGQFADHVLIDDGAIAEQIRRVLPDGVDGAVELVGTNTLPDTLRAVRPKGTVCFTGMLSDQWTIPDFYPMDYLPTGVRLTAYAGEAANLPSTVLQPYLDDAAAGRTPVPIGRVYRLNEIAQAHQDMEDGNLLGKGVILTEQV
ncbi:alcohol dehydrogenase catalytic domain-containing protein [Gordonia sp. CPCC 205333]|uniref:alcohol dehydrogenase catalytic domain-containing protein n=1 Tax=Gordonia sp. CPCC 205333 TaxID=3140790 RepID=UPI003AF3A407